MKIVVTFPPGSANDAAARVFAASLSNKWGKPVVVENKPGAEGTLGAASVVSGRDDHTLLYTVADSVSVAPSLVDNLPYDPDHDLKPISSTTSIVLTLAVSNALAANSIDELIAIIRANPGKFTWTSGPSLPRYVFASFLRRNDLQMTFLGYRDAAQPQADLGEGRIQVLVTSLTASAAPVQMGKARYLAVLNPTRAAALPDLKTARELGHPELEIDGLGGIFGSNTIPETTRSQIEKDVAAVCAMRDVREKLEAGGHNVLDGSADQLRAGIKMQRQWLAEITRIVDIRNAQ
ncbi:Bug family tripartite tricarboxylate transporter substrate binding protein [Bradyrhizobium agreste]|uniref:Bug family tripartite tricarboxylate transporter substrate binding protein n=1 Tax=Bradyrhizobium agreste TaxID=2751811 RepID=UPI00289FC817|nr:tripartite tricarboxylate transporter substrate binding protein [Bradyrhizobium agreste]